MKRAFEFVLSVAAAAVLVIAILSDIRRSRRRHAAQA
jgi:hypothetical protein